MAVRMWNWLVQPGSRRLIVGSAVLSTGTFLIPIALAFLLEQGEPEHARIYLSTTWPYLVWIGVVWVAGWLTWGLHQVPHLLSTVRPALDMAPSEFEALERRWSDATLGFPRLGIRMLLPTMVLLLAFIGIAADSLTNWFGWQDLAGPGERGAVMAIHVPETALVVVLATSALYRFTRIAIDIASQPLSPVLSLARACLRRLATVGATVSVGWLGAVVLVLIAIWPGLQQTAPLAIAAALTMSAAGLALFLVPIVVLEKQLHSLKIELLGAISDGPSMADQKVRPSVSRYRRQLLVASGDERPEALAKVASESTWIVTPGALATGLTAVLVPVLSIFIS